MEIISTKGADLLALRQAIAPTTKRYKSSDRSAVSELANLQARTNPGSTIRKAMTKKPSSSDGFFYGVPGGLEEEIISGGDYFNERRRFVSFEANDNAADKALQIK